MELESTSHDSPASPIHVHHRGLSPFKPSYVTGKESEVIQSRSSRALQFNISGTASSSSYNPIVQLTDSISSIQITPTTPEPQHYGRSYVTKVDTTTYSPGIVISNTDALEHAFHIEELQTTDDNINRNVPIYDQWYGEGTHRMLTNMLGSRTSTISNYLITLITSDPNTNSNVLKHKLLKEALDYDASIGYTGPEALVNPRCKSKEFMDGIT
ncbi:hypothetical protein HMI54_012872 [Coelomomyces lativittatus]|nr:hypothetical protein HMI56_005304 [Coelomomyces lativittatus]KAJ1498212.1 hypothetical protein HMI54_012872 [Coelomomyces lativittatus]KAJ1498218.1 hypothetical protein HMI55_005055 [Coelomomyces lativittatus]